MTKRDRVVIAMMFKVIVLLLGAVVGVETYAQIAKICEPAFDAVWEWSDYTVEVQR